MERFVLKELLLSYNESYVPKMDVEGMISVKKYIYSFNKRKQNEIMSLNFVLRIEKLLSEESCCGVRVTMCCSLNYCQHFPQQMMRLFRHEFWNKSLEERIAHMLEFQKVTLKRNYNHAKFVMLQERDLCKTIWYKIMGISRSTHMSYK
jgi:hypothetical protein